jgi:predicted membrane channel-forming protein YqfA (hemolysin III family)
MRMLNFLLSNLYNAAILNLFGESLTRMLVSHVVLHFWPCGSLNVAEHFQFEKSTRQIGETL